MRHIFDYIRKHKLLLFLIILAFIFHMLVILPSGSYFCYQKRCGLFFWGASAHDGIWHLALAATAFKSWPFSMPNFAGAKLTGYNFLLDLVIYFLSKGGIPTIFSYFKLIPFIWFFAFTGILVILARKIKDSAIYVFWLLFFCFFGSSFTYLFTLYHQKTIWSSSSLLSMQSGQTLTNLPFAISLVFLLLILFILKKKIINWKVSLILGFLLFINFGLKFYAGAVSAAVVYLFLAIDFLFSKKKRDSKSLLAVLGKMLTILMFIITAIFVFYDPLGSTKTGSIFIFSPFATMHSMIEEPILFYLRDMVNARYFLYANAGFSSQRLIFIELFSSILFLFFSMGLRVLGLTYFFIKLIKKKITIFDTAIFLAAIFSYLFLIFFTQKGQWWNTVQFYYYFLFLMNFFTAEFFYQITKNKKVIFYFVIIIVIFLSLPGNLDIIKGFLVFPGHTYISHQELEALSFLKKQPQGIVLTFKVENGKSVSPKPLYLAEDSSYIPAFSSQKVFFADEMQLQITGVAYEQKLQRLKNNDCSILKEVNYLYQIRGEKSIFFDTCLNKYKKNLIKIFGNSAIIIFKTK